MPKIVQQVQLGESHSWFLGTMLVGALTKRSEVHGGYSRCQYITHTCIHNNKEKKNIENINRNQDIQIYEIRPRAYDHGSFGGKIYYNVDIL